VSLTWKQFKDAVEKNGVSDDMEISYIDTHAPMHADDVEVVVDDEVNFFSVCS
jgi:hypothetical protein